MLTEDLTSNGAKNCICINIMYKVKCINNYSNIQQQVIRYWPCLETCGNTLKILSMSSSSTCDSVSCLWNIKYIIPLVCSSIATEPTWHFLHHFYSSHTNMKKMLTSKKSATQTKIFLLKNWDIFYRNLSAVLFYVKWFRNAVLSSLSAHHFVRRKPRVCFYRSGFMQN